jgi:hypothetical protein
MKQQIILKSFSAIILPFSLSAGEAGAQSDQRKEFIEGLFRQIFESRNGQPQQGPGAQPITPVPPVPPAGQVQAVPKSVMNYRSQIGAYATETNNLANGLAAASQKNPALRSYLPEVYAVRSQAAILHQQSSAVNTLTVVDANFRSLDIAWRNLSYRLNSDRGLDNQCRTCVKNIDGYANKLCGLFGIQADFDRIQATVIAAKSSAYIDALLDVL